MTSRRASASAVALTVLAVGVMLLLIMFAARTGPQRIIHGTLVDPSLGPITPSIDPPPLPGGGNLHPGNGRFHSDPVLRAIGLAIRFALVALAVWGAYRLLLALRNVVVTRRRPPPPPEHVDFDVLDDPEALAEEIRADAADQLALLLGGTPRNAIVACWDRFEEQAERVNAARKDWETSSEFTLRLLDRVSADPDAVTRLEMLYHEARFSTHTIGESRRDAAIEALHAIHQSLGAGAVHG